jgi:hypothetical protein
VEKKTSGLRLGTTSCYPYCPLGDHTVFVLRV